MKRTVSVADLLPESVTDISRVVSVYIKASSEMVICFILSFCAYHSLPFAISSAYLIHKFKRVI